ncbi:MAG: carbamoyl-phosphate synthase large subunit [Spirochaetia bacterium]|nr:carbamoyl-phosphate synthase large subunit [Spirochaetia bacterium]
MPRRQDIKSILIPGSGPIIIGQASEFDYSGTQACKALKKEGFRIILVNSNPATIMTDPTLADATYVEPLTPEILEKIIEKERPDAILPTVGGQTALNLTIQLHEKGILEKYNVKLLGANIEAIHRAESRQQFKKIMDEIGLKTPESVLCNDYDTALAFKNKIGLPLIIRPSFTLGGTGGGIAFTDEDFDNLTQSGLSASPTNEILVEQSILGWKEFELEVMRDHADNVVIVCSIENLDPMGVHTGDSITIAPQQTLTDVQYQEMRDASLKIIRAIGVETGGSNIQFGVNPANGELVVIEMNPRVSRSSALASKATGFPIAKIAALLAVGYSLDEIKNDITQVTPASFEPTIDYVVTKIPRFTFEKFPGSNNTLGSQMKSVGETMSIARTFKQSFQKACRSLETERYGFGFDGNLNELFLMQELTDKSSDEKKSYITELIKKPHPERIFFVNIALQLEKELGFTVSKIYEITGIDPWFLTQLKQIVEAAMEFSTLSSEQQNQSVSEMKELGFSDRQLTFLIHKSKISEIIKNSKIPVHARRKDIISLLVKEEKQISALRKQNNIYPVYKKVDTCAGEFEAHTPYLYSSYEEEDESEIHSRKKVMILGGGPNRIGQGIEFDYCCCHASFALQDMKITSIMVNSNPETVSTDYDTSDKLYFEPLTAEDVIHICRNEKPDGIIVQYGGQTPLKLARAIENAGYKIIGTQPDAIDRAEDRDRFSEMLKDLGLQQPDNGIARSFDEAKKIVNSIGYPCLVRPSYVLGGRAMAIVHNEDGLTKFFKEAENINPEHPILVDKFLENAIEIDVDAMCDGEEVFVAGIMQHVEEAGIHSGDSSCVIPPVSLSSLIIDEIKDATAKIALELGVIGLLNIQFAVQNEILYVIEVNPRASRTVPFVSKATGVQVAKIATRLMCGEKIKDQKSLQNRSRDFTAVKEAVLPFSKFPGADIILGPEMKSTGEVMGFAKSFEESYIKAILGSGEKIPESGGVFFSIAESAKPQLTGDAIKLRDMGFKLYGTKGTCEYLKKHNIEIIELHKMSEDKHPNPLDVIKENNINIIINIPLTDIARDDGFIIRQEAIRRKILCITTVPGTRALVNGMLKMKSSSFDVQSLQEVHG